MDFFPKDYLERVHAGVLGKVIGVYVGHPAEGKSYDFIREEYDEIWHYVHPDINKIIEPDDDITGTFLFPTAVEDYPFNISDLGCNIAKVWLNGLVEHESALAWSGKGVSTEHTAFLNLKEGIMPPLSGSIEINGAVVAQQVGGQIFMECWGLMCPNEPERAVKIVTEAVRVHHDGEALYGAIVGTAIISMAFSEKDMKRNLEEALQYIPENSNIYLINKELLRLREETNDWREAYKYLLENHSYSYYPGKCPVEPNHGIIILALLYGENNFAKSLMIVNSCGLDADGNSALVGCILGVATGIGGINEDADFIGPMRGLVYVPYAEGGEVITDCANLAERLVSMAEKMKGSNSSFKRSDTRFPFRLPAANHGFQIITGNTNCPYVEIADTSNHNAEEIKGLEINYKMLTISRTIKAETLTFEEYDKRDLPWYKLTASPTLYAGQKIRMGIISPDSDVEARLFVCINAMENQYITVNSEYYFVSKSNDVTEITFIVPETLGRTIGKMGFEIKGHHRDIAVKGKVIISYIDWKSEPNCMLIPEDKSILMEKWWNFAWIGSINIYENVRLWVPSYLRLAANKETVVISQGTRDWTNYKVTAKVMPHTFVRGGIGIRCRGIKRYIALLLTSRKTLQLVAKLDDEEIILEEKPCEFGFDLQFLTYNIEANGDKIVASVNDVVVCGTNPYPLLSSGGVAIIVEDGGIRIDAYQVNELLS